MCGYSTQFTSMLKLDALRLLQRSRWPQVSLFSYSCQGQGNEQNGGSCDNQYRINNLHDMLKTRHLDLFLVVLVACHTVGRAVWERNHIDCFAFCTLQLLLLAHEPVLERARRLGPMLAKAPRMLQPMLLQRIATFPLPLRRFSSDESPSRLEWRELGDAETHVPGAVGDDGTTWAHNLIRGPGGIFPPDRRKGRRRKGQVTQLSARALHIHALSVCYCVAAICEANAGQQRGEAYRERGHRDREVAVMTSWPVRSRLTLTLISDWETGE